MLSLTETPSRLNSRPPFVRGPWLASLISPKVLPSRVNGTGYLDGGGGWLANSNLPAAGGALVSYLNAPVDPASVPDVTLSDTFQASTPFTSPTLSGKIVGIIPFVWVKSLAPALGSLKNITTAQSYDLLKGSYTYGGGKVYAIGLYEGSGARLAAYENASGGIDNGDIGPGPTYPSVPQQYEFAASGTPALWPVYPGSIDGFAYNHPGHSGYSSGAIIAAALSTAMTVPYVGYVEVADNGGGGLTFNGWPYNVGYVDSGHYTFWAYEHFLYLPTLSGTALAVVQQLATYVAANASVSGLPIQGMKVHRNGDGQPIKVGGTPPNVP
jgi:hypothetical protein